MQTPSAPSAPPRSRSIRVATTFALTILAMLGVGSALAQVAPSWPQFQGDAGKAGAGSGPAPGYRTAWTSPVDPAGPGARYGLSAPVVADDAIVAVGPVQVLGFDRSTGVPSFSVDRAAGPSVPAAIADVAGGLVVYTEGWGDGPPDPGATDAADTPSPSTADTTGSADADEAADTPALGRPALAAVDLATQRSAWPPVALDGVSRTGVTTSGNLAFVGTNRGTVYAVDVTEGDIAWRRDLDALVATSIAVADDVVLVGLQGDRDTQPVVVALDAASGEERWRHEPEATSAVVSATSADDEAAYAIFSGLSETRVEAIALGDGAMRWSRRVNGAFDVAPPLVAQGTVVVTDLIGHTRAFDAADGAERWDFAQNVPTFGGVPVLVDGTVVVPSREGDIGAIDAASGELVWRRPADGSPMRALAPAGDLVIGVRGGAASGLEALEHDPGAALLAEPSPTIPDWGPMLASIAIAVVPVLAVVLAGGRWLGRRQAPPDDEAPAAGDDATVRDPWEDDGDPVS